MYREKVGIIGGFGAYATLNFYKRLLEEFASESERNYPHIIMDNNFTMPSRTRALLYGEAYDEVVDGISDSIQLMMQNDVSKIILVCGTARSVGYCCGGGVTEKIISNTFKKVWNKMCKSR